MGIVKQEDLIAWQDGIRIICLEYGDPGGAMPLTKHDFDEGDIVICDETNERIF